MNYDNFLMGFAVSIVGLSLATGIIYYITKHYVNRTVDFLTYRICASLEHLEQRIEKLEKPEDE